jgi:hypothetical protein
MWTRREFLKGSVVTFLLIPVATSCGSDNPSACQGTGGTSTPAGDGPHTHTLCVPVADLTNPPASGRTYLTSSADGHSHSILITQQQLQTIAANQGITLTTAATLGHSHDFTLQRAPVSIPAGLLQGSSGGPRIVTPGPR